jgi:hypothetical protein
MFAAVTNLVARLPCCEAKCRGFADVGGGRVSNLHQSCPMLQQTVKCVNKKWGVQVLSPGMKRIKMRAVEHRFSITSGAGINKSIVARICKLSCMSSRASDSLIWGGPFQTRHAYSSLQPVTATLCTCVCVCVCKEGQIRDEIIDKKVNLKLSLGFTN